MSVIVDVVINTDQAEQQLQDLQQQMANDLAQSASRMGAAAGQAATATARAAGKNANEEFLRSFDPDKLKAELESAGLGEQEIEIILKTTEAKAETQRLKDAIASAAGEASGIASDSLKQISAQLAREIDRNAGKVHSMTEVSKGVDAINQKMDQLATAAGGADDATEKLFDIEKSEQYVQALGDVFDVVTRINENFKFMTEQQSKAIEDLGSIMTAGAGAGAIFGPWGAAIGALVAGLAQVSSEIFNIKTNTAQEQREAAQRLAQFRELAVGASFDVGELESKYRDFSEIDLANIQSDLRGMATEQAALIAEVEGYDPKKQSGEISVLDEKIRALSEAQLRLIQGGYSSLTDNIKKSIEELDNVDAKPKSADTLRREMSDATAKIAETKTALIDLAKRREAIILATQTSKKGIFQYDFNSAAELFEITKKYFDLIGQGKQAIDDKKKAEEGLAKASTAGVATVSAAQQQADAREKVRLDARLEASKRYFEQRSALLNKFSDDDLEVTKNLSDQMKQQQIGILEGVLASSKSLTKSSRESIRQEIDKLQVEMKAADITFPMDKALNDVSKLLEKLPPELREGFALKVSTAGSVEEIQSISTNIQKAINESPIFLPVDRKGLERQFAELPTEIRSKFQQDFDKILDLKVGFDPKGIVAGKEKMADLFYTIKQFEKQEKAAAEASKKAQEDLKKQIDENIKAIDGFAGAVGTIYMNVAKAVVEGESASKALSEGIKNAVAEGLMALAKEFGVKAIGQLASGWAAAGMGALPAAAAHFKSAALYTAAAAAAGLGSAAVSSMGGQNAAPNVGGGGGGAVSSSGGVGGTSNSLGGGSQQSTGTPSPIVVDLRGAVFPTSDLTGAQQFGEAVARSLAAAAAGNQPLARRLIGTRGFVV